MLVSVLMPVFNGEKYLEDGVKSILSQTFSDFELILVDDGSTDSSLELAEALAKQDSRVKIVKLPEHKNISVALNAGLEACSGKYVVRADADDWCYPDRLEKQVNFMEENLEVAVSGGRIEICDESLRFLNYRKYPKTDSRVRKKIFHFSPFAHPATIWRTDLMKQAGGYNESFEVAQDYDLYFRVGQLGKFANLDDVLIRLRTHKKSSSMKKGRRQEIVTLFTRCKAAVEYGYKMSFSDKVYTVLQAASMLLIPSRLKFWIFNFIRRS